MSAAAIAAAFLLISASIRLASAQDPPPPPCPCNIAGGLSPHHRLPWHLLSLLLSILGCACAFLIGAMNRRALKPPPTFSIDKLPHLNGLVKSEKLYQHQHQQQQQQHLSIVEQLVPEITQHVLCYLDFKSLCSVSMTNVAMKKAANDETVWKSLYHKDWNSEQQSIVPPSGWKAYYAVTKAVVEANRSFYSKFRAKSLRGMAQLWLHADYVKCIHPGGELISGFDAVMENWRSVFDWSQRYDFELQDVKVRVRGDMAWVTSKAFVNASVEPLLSTNCYEFHDRQWYVVHHHCSPQLDFAVSDYGMFA